MYTLVVDPVLAILAFAALALFAGIWAYRLETGVPFHPFVAFVEASVCLALFFFVETGTWLGLAATAPLDLLLLCSAGLAGATYGYDSSRIVRRPNGRPGYRGSAAIAAYWFILLTLTVATELVFLDQVTVLGLVSIQGIPNPAPGLASEVGASGALVLALVDAFFAVTTGLVLGQLSGVHVRLARHWWYHRAPPSVGGAGAPPR